MRIGILLQSFASSTWKAFPPSASLLYNGHAKLQLSCRLAMAWQVPRSLFRSLLLSFIFFSFTGPECTSYTVDKQADRSVTYANVNSKCDSALATAWYRFNGTAGSKMPTSCLPSDKCNTAATGWLDGAHPTPHGGVVNRRVCFSWGGGCCRWQVSIKVKNCGSFYVYRLTKPPNCHLRYCVTK